MSPRNRQDYMSASLLACHNVGAGGVLDIGCCVYPQNAKREYQIQLREARAIGELGWVDHILKLLKAGDYNEYTICINN